MSEPTPEQIAQMQQQLMHDQQTRAALLQGFGALYKQVTDFIGRLGMAPHIKSWCIMNLDQGAMWAREGINAMQFNFQSQPPQPPQAPQEGKPEGEKKEEAPKEDSEPKQEEKPQE